MRQNDISELPKLEQEKIENAFNVYQTEDGYFYYNLIQNIVFPANLPKNLFTTYIAEYGDSWPLISYKSYQTPQLWWIILLANQIINATELPTPGKIYDIPVLAVAQEILAQTSKR